MMISEPDIPIIDTIINWKKVTEKIFWD
jgi:hypothetical protein